MVQSLKTDGIDDGQTIYNVRVLFFMAKLRLYDAIQERMKLILRSTFP